MHHAVRPSRRAAGAVLAAALLGVVVVPAAQAGPRAPASGVKNYAASASPAVVPLVAAGSTVTVELRNCGTCAGARSSSVPFGSAEVSFPDAVGLSTTGLSAVTSTGAVWSVAVLAEDTPDTVLRLTAGSAATVAPGGSVRLAIGVPGTARPGQVVFPTRVKQSNDFSGEGNDFADVGQPASAYLGSGPAVGLEWVSGRGPTPVQVSPAAVATTGVTGAERMCPAPQVRVVDALGNTVTSGAHTVQLVSADSRDPGLAGATATTVGGVATLGDATCSSGVSASALGFGYVLRATASGLTSSAVSVPFDVLAVYGRCGADCSTGDLQGRQRTTARVEATGGTGETDLLTFFFETAPWDLAAVCDPDPGAEGTNPERDPLTLDLPDHDKTLHLRWTKKAVQWATNNGASKWQVCFAAQYPFDAVGGVAVAVPGEPGWWVGALLPCPSEPTGPCLRTLGRNGGEQVATVFVPDQDGDPRVY